MLLLDTHAWVWLINGDKRIKTQKWLTPLLEAARQSQLYISAISVWEVAMLEAKGRLQLDRSCGDWIEQALHQPGLQLIQLEPGIAIESSRLPGAFHGDPADRILVASARKKNLSLVSADQRILRYGRQGYVRLL